jgi:hypothetical protein
MRIPAKTEIEFLMLHLFSVEIEGSERRVSYAGNIEFSVH